MHNEITFPVITRLLLPILLIVGSSMVQGRTNSVNGETRWNCHVGRDMAITCELGAMPAATTGFERVPDAFDTGLATASTDARAGRLPAIVQTLRERPGDLAGLQVKIPLHTDPTDMVLVRELAQAVMCGSRPDCRVDFRPTDFDLAKLSAADLVDATDAAMGD